MLISGGRDKDIDLAALAAVVAERAVGRRPDRRERPGLEALFRAAGRARPYAPATSTTRSAADAIARELLVRPTRRGPATVLLSPAAASFDMFVDYAARGRAFSLRWRCLPRPEAKAASGEPQPADPAPRAAAPHQRPDRRTDRTTASRTPQSRAGAVRRERHSADDVILVVVVALTAIGILMVYSSSALKNYMSQDADTFATVGRRSSGDPGHRRDGVA